MPPPSDLVLGSRLDTCFPSLGLTVQTFIEPGGARRRATREEHWRRDRRLGRGGFGEVFLERCVAGEQAVAIRALKVMDKNGGQTSQYDRELEAIAKFSHERYRIWFVKSFGWFESDDSICIAMEYCKNGDLHRFLTNQRRLSVAEVKQITIQILGGLHEMHRNDFAHRDLKPGNILIRSRPPDEWWVVLADFGISKRAEETHGPSTVKGTEQFMAPEFRGFSDPHRPTLQQDFKAGDMWALGEICQQAQSGRPVFPNLPALFEYYKDQSRFPVENIPSSFGVNGIALTADAALQHPWMKEVHDTHDARRDTDRSIDTQRTPVNTTSTRRRHKEPSASWSAISNGDKDRTMIPVRGYSGAISEISKPSAKTTSPRRHRDEPTASWSAISDQGTNQVRTAVRVPLKSDQSFKIEIKPDFNPFRRLFGTKRNVQSLKGHTNGVSSEAFSPDGSMLASGSYDKTVRLWDSRSGWSSLQTLKGYTGGVYSVAFPPDGSILASGSWDGKVRLWDTRSGWSSLWTLKGHKHDVRSVTFLPDGGMLASGSRDRTIRLWDIGDTR